MKFLINQFGCDFDFDTTSQFRNIIGHAIFSILYKGSNSKHKHKLKIFIEALQQIKAMDLAIGSEEPIG